MEIEIKKLLSGDQQEWRSFLAQATPLIYSAISHILHNQADIEDITQSVYLKLFSNDYKVLRTFDSKKASISTWICVIAKRQAIDFIRKDKSPLHTQFEKLPDSGYTDPVPGSEEEKPEIPMDILTGREKLLLHLSYDREYSQEKISEIMNIKLQSLRNAKHRALEKLRKACRSKEHGA